MPTTTIRLPEELKELVASVALAEGVSSHAFIVQAVAEKAGQAKARNEFYAVARERSAEIARTGKTVSLAEMRKYALDVATGRPAKRPKARKLAR
ncbi:MAG: ribbon-helix-helix protein, CopG family [Burkholderiaceae bacterium]|nr:ribbon-helix-helix protein, CopG family [Burkholderiaceae bacterium]